MIHRHDAATIQAWAALGGRRDLAESVSYRGTIGVLPARLPVRELARATVGACSLAAAELLAGRRGITIPSVRVREDAVATAFVSERFLRIDGRAPASFAPLSGFWRAADGWVRTHANYAHHRARLLAALDVPDRGDDRLLADALAAELASRTAQSIQETAYAAGGLAVAVATVPSESRPPLIETQVVGEQERRFPPEALLPAHGVRILDLTRVIAGPIATRTLALLGADVLRIDAPQLREDPDAHVDTGMGKRSALLDLSARSGQATFEDLLISADVVVIGYRPGALDKYGLAPGELLVRRPGLIVAQLNAWGWSGPWAARRGFDSLVQAASGIASIEATADGHPGVLPAQALDHGTGYLLAAAILRSLSEQCSTGGGRRLRLSLAGTASWLLHDIRPAPITGDAYDPQPRLAETNSPYGTLRYVLPPIHYDGAPRTWKRPATRWGTDRPVWN